MDHSILGNGRRVAVRLIVAFCCCGLRPVLFGLIEILAEAHRGDRDKER